MDIFKAIFSDSDSDSDLESDKDADVSKETFKTAEKVSTELPSVFGWYTKVLLQLPEF